MLSNPEFAREGSAITDQLSPDRVMIGGPSSAEGEASIAVLKTLYSNWVPTGRIITSNLWSAEISKLTADAFLAQVTLPRTLPLTLPLTQPYPYPYL